MAQAIAGTNNELVDKEVESVIKKNEHHKAGSGFMLPMDDDDDDGQMGDAQDMDDDGEEMDDDEEDQEDLGENDDEDENEEDEINDDEDEDEDIEQQIVNITNKNNRPGEGHESVNNEAILVINNDQKERPQTNQVKHRQAATSQGQRPAANHNNNPRY